MKNSECREIDLVRKHFKGKNVRTSFFCDGDRHLSVWAKKYYGDEDEEPCLNFDVDASGNITGMYFHIGDTYSVPSVERAERRRKEAMRRDSQRQAHDRHVRVMNFHGGSDLYRKKKDELIYQLRDYPFPEQSAEDILDEQYREVTYD